MQASRAFASVLSIVAMLISLTACATAAGKSMRPLRIVNATYDGVTSVAIAPSGSGDFHVIALAHPLPGGLASVMVDVPPGACRRDVRVTFRGDRTLLYRQLDVCRSDGLRLAAGASAGRPLLPEGELDTASSP